MARFRSTSLIVFGFVSFITFILMGVLHHGVNLQSFATEWEDYEMDVVGGQVGTSWCMF